MKVKDLAIIACAAATDLTDYDGYGVIADATLPGTDMAPPGVKIATAASGDCVGVITTPADGSTDNLSVALKGFGGTVRCKLGGACDALEKLTLMASGKFEGGGTGTVVARALEAGVSDELVEAVLIEA